jgi:cytochrome P450
LIPTPLLPVLAPIFTFPNRKHSRAYTKILKPEILRRQRLLQQHSQTQKTSPPSPGQTGDAEKSIHSKAEQPNDFLQWLLTRSQTTPQHYTGSPDETDADVICARLLHINFASVHTTSFIGTNVLLDILASDPADKVIEMLRQEALNTQDHPTSETNATPPPTAPTWSRSGLSKMYLLDSVLRESSRLASIIGVGVNHIITSPSGITLPDGTHLPKGNMLATHSWGLHHDDSIYAEADKFQPFRFADMGARTADGDESGVIVSKEEKERNVLEKANLQFVATSEKYLGFGHGRHACPGRFFASAELKLLVATLLTRFEVEIVGDGNGKGRPECFWAGPNHVPPMGAKVRVRRRVEVEGHS